MDIVEILVAWFLLSLTGALAPGPLSAAVIMQSSRRGKLHGILPMCGHAIVELGIIILIIFSVQVLMFEQAIINGMILAGGLVIIFFGLLALRDYKYKSRGIETRSDESTNISTAIEATVQGATVSILSPYFLLWWFGIGLTNVTILVAQLQVGVGTVLIAAVLLYFTHISTDFLYGAFLTIGTDEVSKRTIAGGINWVNVAIGIFQIALGIWFILQVLLPIS